MKAKQQLDLFEWADRRPTADIINFIPHVVRQIIRQRGQPRVDRGGKLVDFPRAAPTVRRLA